MPPSPSRSGLRIEALEDRTVPTALGSPWPNPDALTLSFASNGTAVGTATSQNTAAFGGISASVWQREILRAFQTWAVQTNANIGLVSDGGAALGTPGQAQGDFRFGDIRVGSVPLSADSIANASPFDWSAGTWSGDVLFNSLAKFSTGPASASAADLYTIALHEAGHVFGMAHSDDPASVMYEDYTGPRTGLSAADIATVRSYYGARQPDAYEGARGNNTPATATPVDTITGAAKLTADIGSNADVDDYALLNTTLLGNLEVRVKTSGISLLTPKVSVYDMFGRLVASGTAAGPGQDVTVTIPRTLLNLSYTVQVTGATGDVFGIGGYQMEVVRTSGLILPHLLTEVLGGNSLLGAVSLDGLLAGPDDSDGYAADAAVDSRTDVDYYSVSVPPTTDASPRAMVVSVTNNSGRAHPDLAVLDADGSPVPFQILANNAGTLTVQVTQIRRGETYFIRVSNPAGVDATGKYHLTTEFQAPVDVTYQRLGTGRLTAAAPTATTTLTVNATRLFEFALSSAAADAASTGGATLTVRDASGKAVLALSLSAGGITNGAVYLAPGTYTVTIGAPGGATDFWDGVRVASDPVGPYDSGTSSSYPSSGSDSGTYSTSSSGGASAPVYQSPPSQPNSTSSSTAAAPPPPGSRPSSSMYYYSF